MTKETIHLDFDSQGNVSSLKFTDVEFIASEWKGNGLFRICLRDFVGNPLLLERSDFRSVRRTDSKGTARLVFSDCIKFPDTVVNVSATPDGPAVSWRISVAPGSEDFAVEWIDFPRLRLGRFPDGKYLLPFAEGTLLTDLEKREHTATFRCETAEYPLSGVGGFYPGPAAMQFEAFYTGDAGLCILCRDPEHFPKSIDFRPDGDAAVPFLQHFTGGENAVAYDVAVIGFRGDWQTAAEIYRNWMEHHDPRLPARLHTRLPDWLAASPVILAYPVKGSGLDHGGLIPNEYYPYSAALPVMEQYRRRWNCGIMALLMHWEGTAPWAPPYIWPPSGGEEMLAQFIRTMHLNGNRVGLYASGIGWTQKSMIDPAYDRTRQFSDEHLEQEVCVGPRGEAFSRVCNGLHGQRIGYDLCPERPFTQSLVVREVAAASGLGVDYLQYFDQNQGGAAPLCYSKRHGHPALPGAWHTASMRHLLDKAQEAAGETVLGCENAAAEPYMKVCCLNDLRSHLAWGTGGIPVPLYSFVFHEYAAGFSGNGVCLSGWVDVERTPFFLQWTMGWNFACGNLLSVVLKNGGKIHWHWNLPWSFPEPAQEPLIELIGNLTRWRRGMAAEFLVAGRMEGTPAVSCGTRTIYLKNHPPVEVPAVTACAWSHEGRRAVLLVNCGEKPEACRIDFTHAEHGTIHFSEKRNTGTFEGKYALLEVPPLDAVLISLSPKKTTTRNER